VERHGDIHISPAQRNSSFYGFIGREVFKNPLDLLWTAKMDDVNDLKVGDATGRHPDAVA
jgi:hypothetical protein